jgi:hypothetical protein
VRQRLAWIAALLALGALAWITLPRIAEYLEAARIASCRQGMLEVYKDLVLYEQKNGHMPAQAEFERFADASSFYAVRDLERFPLRQFPSAGDELLLADKSTGGHDHRTCTVVLWADGRVSTLEYDDPAVRELLDPSGKLVVGPNSPIEALRKLRLD